MRVRYDGKYTKFWRVLLFLGILLPGLFWADSKVLAEETQRQKIRVGYPIQSRITERTEDGGYQGYTYEYLMEIQKYTDWNYEFVEVEGTLDEQLITLLKMLETGEIDLLGCMAYDESYAQIYDYPGYNYGTTYHILCVLGENSELTSENLFQQSNLQVGVFSRNKQANTKLEQFSQITGIQIEQIFADSEEELLHMLSEGKTDAILWKDISLSDAENLETIARFSPQPFYFAVTKGKKEIINGLNRAISMIENMNPYFGTNLWEKYFSIETKRLILTKEEKEYIENAGTLKAVAFGGKAPIQYIDKTQGEFRGISVKLLNYISELTGLTIELTMTDSFEDYQNLVIGGQADFVVGISDEMLQYDWQKFLVTMPYLEVPLSFVSEKELDPAKIEGKCLALPQGVHYDGLVNGNIRYFETLKDCIQAVRDGTADYCYMNNYSAQYYVSNYEFRTLATFLQPEEWSQKYCFGIQDSRQIALISILNKCIQMFRGTNLLQEYLYANAYQQEDISFSSYLNANFSQVIMIVVVFVLSLIIVTLLCLRQKEKQKEHLRRMENERYQLISELSNEYLFEYDIKNERLKLPGKTADFLNMPKEIEHALHVLKQNEVFAGFFQEPGDRSEECMLLLQDGKQQWIRVITKAILDEKGQMTYLIGKLVDIQKEKEEREQLLTKAERDSLTGLFNIAAFRERASHKLTTGSAHALIILDLDHFKEINDTCGHYTGDYVLSRTGEIIQETFGLNGLCGRLGGDEFVIFYPYDGMLQTVETMCASFLEKLAGIEYTGQRRQVTASIGVAVTEPGLDFSTIYQRADLALYRIKKHGRNGFRIFSEPYLLRGQ